MTKPIQSTDDFIRRLASESEHGFTQLFSEAGLTPQDVAKRNGLTNAEVFEKDLDAIMNLKIDGAMFGQPGQDITVLQALLLRLATHALNGSTSSIDKLVQWYAYRNEQSINIKHVNRIEVDDKALRMLEAIGIKREALEQYDMIDVTPADKTVEDFF
jgi:TRAP-type uncharacterized transport system substrate-binding protein